MMRTASLLIAPFCIAFCEVSTLVAATAAEEFLRLSKEEQQSKVVAAFERRLEHARNVSYEVDLPAAIFENRNGHPGALRTHLPFRHCKAWRLGDSYRIDSDLCPPQERKPGQVVSSSVDAEKGINRSMTRLVEQNKTFARIDTIQDGIITDNRYMYWLDGDYRFVEDYLFRDILIHRKEFEFNAASDKELVELTIGYRPGWADTVGGKRVFLLDPHKGFLPVFGESRWDLLHPRRGHDWRIERFVVSDSKLVGDVWMPTKLREEIAASPAPETIAVHETEVLSIEHGSVQPKDVQVEFPEGTKVVDATKAITYIVDENGKPTEVERAYGPLIDYRELHPGKR